MASSSPSDSNRTEQIISHFFQKALHVILSSRVPHLSGGLSVVSSASRRRDRWFHLALGDLPSALDDPSLAGNLNEPLVIDVLLTPRASSDAGDHVVERWTVHCEPSTAAPRSGGGDDNRSYKKSIVLLRSMYAMLRLLPAFRIFRLLLSSGNRAYNYDLGYRISSFAAPFSRAEESRLRRFDFTHVESLVGHLVVSVQYRPSLAEFRLEMSSSGTPSVIIMDYIGSPAAERIKTFPSSLPDRGSRPILPTVRTARASSSSSTSPAVAVLDRPHSWANAPMAHYPLSGSPGQVSELKFSPPENYRHPSKPSHQRISFSFDEHKVASPLRRQSGFDKGSSNFDDYKLSPPFSMSPTPSPPTRGTSYLTSRLQSETAPVSIPVPWKGKGQLSGSPNLSDPPKSLYPPPSPRTPRTDFSSGSPSESKLSRKSEGKSEGLRAGDIYSNLLMHTTQKGLRDGRDDSGRFSTVLSSGGSPRFGFSRSSSRLSIPDDLDDGDFSYPFAVDDVDTSDSQTRSLDGKEAPESASSHKSQDAAVGILVHMLKTAPPLRQDQSCSVQSSRSELTGDGGTSSFSSSRRASDALEELQIYRDMKNLLLSRSGSKLPGSVDDRKE